MSCGSRSAVPITANGQRSRSHSASKCSETIGIDRQHVALLRFVAPDLHRRHAGLFARYRAQIEVPAHTRAMHELGQRIGQPARSHIVYR